VLEAVSLALLALTLATAIVRPRLEAVVSVPCALAVILIGALSWSEAGDELRAIAPTLGFLAAMLVVAMLCDREGLFAAAGAWMAGASRGEPVRLLALVFVVAALVTATLSLDTTVLLLTPVVLTTVARLGLRPRPPATACVHLANSASLLLPISNLSNLLALDASGISFLRFAGLMALPWLAAIAVEWVVLRRAFADELALAPTPPAPTAPATPAPPARVPPHVPVVLGLALVAFAASSAVHVAPAWIALAAAVALGVPALVRATATAADIARSVSVPFLAFVAGLAVIVDGARDHGLEDAVAALVPGGESLPALLAIAAVAAVLANVVNNLPAILILLPIVAGAGPVAVLAALIGVNCGPNLTYVGSLATMLWRRVLHAHGEAPSAVAFTRLGLVVVPATLLASTFALWASAAVLA
jgi:arsenical pump membrane protein